jgi:hypothetical protein
VVKGGYDDEETETETEVKVASKKLAVGDRQSLVWTQG